MGVETEISWCDHTFNPWVGCTKVSAACDNCYAETWAKRTGGAALWQGERRRTKPSNWLQPLKWNKAAEQAGVRKRVFCASLADVFDNQVPGDWRTDLWDLIRATPHLDWLLLTKRPQNISAMLPADWARDRGEGWPNVWLGTTAENQTELARRIAHLVAIRARVRFLSCEPLLGPVNLETIHLPSGLMFDALQGFYMAPSSVGIKGYANLLATLPAPPRPKGKVDWVIVGGESGAKAREMRPDLARALRDQCARAGVPFHFKQWGEWKDGARVGKAVAGCLLDGVEHKGFPA